MIHGVFRDGKNVTIPLLLRGPGGVFDVDAVVDTGFTGELAVTELAVTMLGLTSARRSRLALADGTAVEVDAHDVEVLWFGEWKVVSASVIGADTLIGVRLLTGYRLSAEFAPDGAVTLEPLAVRRPGGYTALPPAAEPPP